jgi:hypothetical protein
MIKMKSLEPLLLLRSRPFLRGFYCKSQVNSLFNKNFKESKEDDSKKTGGNLFRLSLSLAPLQSVLYFFLNLIKLDITGPISVKPITISHSFKDRAVVLNTTCKVGI